ncbi:MAG: DUF6155 family protein [Saprospiraceae bacterium]
MGLSDLKKELKKLDRDQLIDLIADLYKENKSAKEFLDLYVDPNDRELFNKYKDKVFKAFYPTRGYGYKLKDGKQAISDFEKLGPSLDLLADLMLFYVETGVKFTLDFGDIDKAYYNNMESSYKAALHLAKKVNLLDEFANRAEKIVNDTRNIGWGFYYSLAKIYADFYAE